MNLYYDKLQKTDQDRRDTERYAEKRKMTEAEKKKVIFRISKGSLDTAKKMIAASGQKPSEYNPVTRECMAAMIYGAFFATSVEELGYFDWMWTESTTAININHLFEVDIDNCIALVKYLHENDHYTDNPNLNPEIYKLIHYGADAYFCLNQPDRLAKGIQSMIKQCNKLFGTGEEN